MAFEYVVIAFPGDRIGAGVAPAIAELVDREVIRILDLVVIKRATDLTVQWFEFDDLEEALPFASIDGEAGGLLADVDIAAIAEELAPGTSALCLLWEDRWARDLDRAIADSGGRWVAGVHLPDAAVEDALARSTAGAEPSS